MNVYNNYSNSKIELLETGYKQVSKTKFQKHFNKQYPIQILHCCYQRQENGKKIEISEKRCNKLKSIGKDVFIREKFFSKKIEKKLESQFPLHSNSSSFGTLQVLPIELSRYILGFLSPFELNKIKSVSSTFCTIASENSLMQSEYEIAWNNLEIIRFIISTIDCNENSKFIKIALYLDTNGNLHAYKENYILHVKDPITDHFLPYDSRNTREMTEHLYKLSLYWHYDIHELSAIVPQQRTPSQNSLGVWTNHRESFKNEMVNKVAEHIITLANKLYEGANEIAKKEGKIQNDQFRDPVRPLWEDVLSDSINYPMDRILAAGPLNLETQPKKKIYKKGIVYPVPQQILQPKRSPLKQLFLYIFH